MALVDHPLRYALTNELHARPAPAIPAPATAVFLALKVPHDAAARDRGHDRAHLLELLDRYGAPYPRPEATHHSALLGRFGLKWENHTEFTTYTVFSAGLPTRPFDPVAFDVFPPDWLARAPGVRMSSILFHIDRMPLIDGAPDREALEGALEAWFEGESLAASLVLDGAAIVASDFRIDSAGHTRMAVFAHPETGPRRLGRIVQRLCEIEVYKTMSMLGLVRARDVSRAMAGLDRTLTALIGQMTGQPLAPNGFAEKGTTSSQPADAANGGAVAEAEPPGRALPGGPPDEIARAEQALAQLMAVAAELERLEVASSFRFGATRAYEALVNDRIGLLRETRFAGRQTFAEFMRRRYEPAMRTVQSTEARLKTLSERGMRAGQLLSTQVEVARGAQNQRLLASMDRRAGLQLRLQHTVEGLSVVAISYYAVGLVGYVIHPAAEALGLSKTAVMAALVPLVIAVVWAVVRAIRRRLEA